MEEKLIEIAFMFLCLPEEERKIVYEKCANMPELKAFLYGVADKIKAVD